MNQNKQSQLYSAEALRLNSHKTMRKLFLAVFAFFMTATLTFLITQNMKNTNAASFQAGNIMSDAVMGNYNSMSEADIQNFLKSKNSCNKYSSSAGDYSETYGSKTYTWHVRNHRYVCMADDTFNGESAAHIIYTVAHEYRINPQVLIVLLQKEQGLITDQFPNSWQYNKAAGFGCPDTAPCDAQYYGLRTQLSKAANLFRTVLDGGWSNYPVGNNYVQYHPNQACGGSVINIENRATSALYRYTPYQPNGALLCGGSDGCSSYGNYNFYKYFTDWFGDTHADPRPTIGYILSHQGSPVNDEENDLDIQYKTHIGHYGWLEWSNGGQLSGTTGFSLQTEAFQLKLNSGNGIEYRSHVQSYGWESEYKKDGEISGTIGESKRLEAIQIRLTPELAKNYDVYYRAHVQSIGWMDWVKNGEIAGTTGESKRIEAIQIKIVLKNTDNITYRAHVQSIGWMDSVNGAKISGTTGQSLRLEGVKISLSGDLSGGDINYRAHVQSIGWMDWVKNGEIAGTTGQSKRLEAIQLKLSDTLARTYDITYRAHVQSIGWMDWVKNGEIAGTTGQGKRLEALEIKILTK